MGRGKMEKRVEDALILVEISIHIARWVILLLGSGSVGDDELWHHHTG